VPAAAADEMHRGGSADKKNYISERETLADYMACVTPHCFPRHLAPANNTLTPRENPKATEWPHKICHREIAAISQKIRKTKRIFSRSH